MSTLVDLDTFVRDLRRSEILPEIQLTETLADPAYQGLAGHELARQLVRDKKISAYQSNCLQRGRWQDLIYGEYRAVRILHIGGIGYVLLAQQKNVHGWYAIKAIKPDLQAEQAMVDMFRLEAHAMTTLRHPNIVRGLDYGPHSLAGDGHFFVMEFIAGPNLGELVAIAPHLPWQQACDIIAQSARGLQHAHEHGFLHRDVKPGNIIVDHQGIAKLVDFGFAKYVGPEPIFPMAPDRRPGTASFVAPERLIGDKSHSFPADVYGLGMTFYYGLTSSDPFPGLSQKEILRAQVKSQPQPIRELSPDVPDEVVAIFERMTAKQPDQRYQTMAEVAEALEPFAERKKVTVDLRALLHARSRTYAQEIVGPSRGGGGSVLSDIDTAAGSGIGQSGLSHIRQLEEGVRKIADELASQRAENQRLLDRLARRAVERQQLQTLQTEMDALRQQTAALEKERDALQTQAEQDRQTIADLNERCQQLEGSVEQYRAKVDTMNERMRDLTSAVGALEQDKPPRPAAKDVLRSAYEDAQPVAETANDSQFLDEIWSDEDLFRDFEPRSIPRPKSDDSPS